MSASAASVEDLAKKVARANKLFIGSGEFMRACAAANQFPPDKLPEIAFVGRSNVGKSSLINALTDRRSLARSSKTPGRTQQIVFFDIAKTLTLADLPGYGHAKAPREQQAEWNELIHHYLCERPQLVCVCLLIDGRHGALANDLSMMQFLDRAGVSFQVILTKIDKVKSLEQAARREQIEAQLAQHPAARAKALMVSAEKHTGIDELRLLVATLAGQFGK
jgi:GTP-binding protein